MKAISNKNKGSKFKTVYCDLFNTDWEHAGVIPVFSNVDFIVPKIIHKGKLIEYRYYALFINSELQKLGKPGDNSFDEVMILKTAHSKNFISIAMRVGDIIYKVPKMKRQLYEQWFIGEYEKFKLLIKINKNG